MAVNLGDLEFYVGPVDVDPAGPASRLDALETVIVDFIDGAKDTLDIAVQEVDSMPIAEAIVRAQLRKVSVRLVTEADYLIDTKASPHPFDADTKAKQEINRQIQLALLRAMTWVRTDFNPKIFHQKFIIRDRTSVLTGSTNFTQSCTHQNLNHIVVIHDRAVANQYFAEFTEISEGRFGALSVLLEKKPLEQIVADVRVKPCFAPDHGPEMEIMKQMLKARSRIDFAIFTFSGSSGIDDTILALHEKIEIRGVFDKAQAAHDWAPTKTLAAAGIEVYTAGHQKPTGIAKGVGKLHHKLMVIDDSVTIVGSFNYTEPANLYNDENIVILGDHENPTAAQKQIATAARLEIDRIIADHGTRVTV